MLKQDVSSMMFPLWFRGETYFSIHGCGLLCFFIQWYRGYSGLGLGKSTIGDRIWSNYHPMVKISWRYPLWDVKKRRPWHPKRIPQLHGWSLSMNCRDFPRFPMVFLWFPQDFEGISRISSNFFCCQVPIRGTYEGVLRLRPQWSVEIFDPWDCYDNSRIVMDNSRWIEWIVMWSSKYG